jgi:2-amino-4-hydroxy-6-hydroxymethyldihydropteridine diphosphokinase
MSSATLQGIYIALGSNLGDAQANLSSAITACEAFACVLQRSCVYETAALLPAGAPNDWDVRFLNQLIEIETDEAPEALLQKLQKIELNMGRGAHARWSPRVIDLDIIAYQSMVIDTPTLTIPHAEMHKRDFVLHPLCEIAPGWVFPKTHSFAGRHAAEFISETSLALLKAHA